MAAKPLGLVKNAPVATLTTAEALVGAALTFLVTHHIIGNIDVSTTTQTFAPFVALALPAVFGAVKWHLVSPYAKVKDMAERAGVASDADFARIDALLDEKFRDWSLTVDEETDEDTDDQAIDDTDAAHQPEHSAPDEVPSYETSYETRYDDAPALTGPPSMSAGAS